MNILLVSQMNINSPTGVTSYYLGLKNQLVKEGHYVEIITPEETPRIVSVFLKIVSRIILIIKTDFNKLFVSEAYYFIAVYYAVKKVRKKRKWDIINGQDPSSSCAAKFAFKGKVPVISTCHFNDNPVKERMLRYKLSPEKIVRVTKWFKYLFSKTDNLIFVSDYIRNQSAYLLKPESNIRIIHNGVKFYEKKEIDYKPGDFIITNVGTMEDRKNQILLINAASFLKNKGTSFKIWLLGDGPKKEEWQKKVAAENLEEYIVFLGHKKNVTDITKESDLYVHTSKNESSGLCILESFSIGLPVLTLANGGIPEHFPPSRAGLIDPDADASFLADKIYGYFNLEKRRQLQSEEYDFSSSRFTVENMTKQTIDFYNSLTHQNFN